MTSQGRWCFRPRPASNELLSSWLHRLALANATRDHTLCRTMFADRAVWNRDPDRSFPRPQLAVLAGWTGVPLVRIEQLVLGHWEGRLSERVATNGSTPWILPVGVYHRLRRRAGLMYCPACLSAGEADALWMWRMAWSLCCRVHRLRLLDACPSCEGPYMPHRSAPSLLGRMPCAQCGSDLAKAAQSPASVWEWQFQQRLETALLEGRTQIHGRPFLALPLFHGLRPLASVLLSKKGRDLSSRFLGHHGLKVKVLEKTAFELQPIAARRTVMHAAWELLADWPVSFAKHARSVGYRKGDADKVAPSFPFWMQQGIDLLGGQRQRELHSEEVATIAGWMQQEGTEVSWNGVLAAAGLSVPTRIAQPALERILQTSRGRPIRKQARRESKPFDLVSLGKV